MSGGVLIGFTTKDESISSFEVESHEELNFDKKKNYLQWRYLVSARVAYIWGEEKEDFENNPLVERMKSDITSKTGTVLQNIMPLTPGSPAYYMTHGVATEGDLS